MSLTPIVLSPSKVHRQFIMHLSLPCLLNGTWTNHSQPVSRSSLIPRLTNTILSRLTTRTSRGRRRINHNLDARIIALAAYTQVRPARVFCIACTNHSRAAMASAIPKSFWSSPGRYLKWAFHEKPAIAYSVAIGCLGPVSLVALPPLRRAFGDEDPVRIPLSYPSE